LDSHILRPDLNTISKLKKSRKNLKKNLQKTIQLNPHKEIFFFDESRFGTHSKIGHGWFKKGTRTPVNVKLGFENFYVYSAVNPKTGEDFTLFFSNANSDCLNAYLEKLNEYLENRKIIFILDGAGWHKCHRLKRYPNIEFVFLPPYSPELNPVERFWQFIKDNTIKNKVFKTLQEIESEVIRFLNEMTNNILISVCSYPYL
jgi:transposase